MNSIAAAIVRRSGLTSAIIRRSIEGIEKEIRQRSNLANKYADTAEGPDPADSYRADVRKLRLIRKDLNKVLVMIRLSERLNITHLITTSPTHFYEQSRPPT